MTRGEDFTAIPASAEIERRIARQRGAPRLVNRRVMLENMNHPDAFWKLEALSDRQLLERLGSVLGSSRRLMTELIAHLGEVEVRRLHLSAACSSMFVYCLKLGMTEDEAYRRIEVARLARRYPAIFPLLAEGRLTISVVALLKHHLSEDNHLELLAAITGKSVVQARELIAARFPRADVPSTVRKLPERRTMVQPSLTLSMPEEPRANGIESRSEGTEPHNGRTDPCTGGTEPCTDGTERGAGGTEPCTDGTKPRTGATQHSHFERAAPARVASRIEPLSQQRYRVQFTASAELARKLELARDLMRHCQPGGELGPIVERALELLIESLLQRRFGKRKPASPKRPRERAKPEQRGDIATATPATATPATATATLADAKAHGFGIHHGAAELDTATTFATANPEGDRRAERERASAPSHIPRFTRRTVAERDGLGCSWADGQGARCGSRAWLECDHLRPRGKGGGSEPENVRLLCRHHNRFAAEREYGRRRVEQAIAERRRERTSPAI